MYLHLYTHAGGGTPTNHTNYVHYTYTPPTQSRSLGSTHHRRRDRTNPTVNATKERQTEEKRQREGGCGTDKETERQRWRPNFGAKTTPPTTTQQAGLMIRSKSTGGGDVAARQTYRPRGTRWRVLWVLGRGRGEEAVQRTK